MNVTCCCFQYCLVPSILFHAECLGVVYRIKGEWSPKVRGQTLGVAALASDGLGVSEALSLGASNLGSRAATPRKMEVWAPSLY